MPILDPPDEQAFLNLWRLNMIKNYGKGLVVSLALCLACMSVSAPAAAGPYCTGGSNGIPFHCIKPPQG